jgi:hypothetical protein
VEKTPRTARVFPTSDHRDDPLPSDLADDAVHRWYRIIMGFDWKLVESLIDRLHITPAHTVLDPFCGAGTTLVQCKKQGIDSIGIDANPVCILASQVKANWRLEPNRLTAALDDVLERAASIEIEGGIEKDTAYRYLLDSGMIDRGWLSLHKARKVIALSTAIKNALRKPAERHFFQLALASALVHRIADIKFGPEVYCLAEPKRSAVIQSFASQATTMIEDISRISEQQSSMASTKIAFGDSRRIDVLHAAAPKGVDFVITSPPYPNEHDYTRSTRLELILLDHVRLPIDLQPLKQRMVRCNTKGLYKEHARDASYSSRYPTIRRIANELDKRAKQNTDRFSKLYGQLIREYFGGMICHLRAVMQTLRPEGYCAYVVRDQQSLLGLYVDTPKILCEVAQSPSQGFRVKDVVEWRKARGSTGKRMLSEKILILQKPNR